MAKQMSNIDKKVLAEQIIDVFEEFLNEYGINIPNPEKEDKDINPDEISNIYGYDCEYIEEKVIQVLKDFDLIAD